MQDVLVMAGQKNAKAENICLNVIGRYGLEIDMQENNFSISSSPVISSLLHSNNSNYSIQKDINNGSQRNQIDYIINKRRWKSSATTAKTWAEANYITDYKLMCKFQVVE